MRVTVREIMDAVAEQIKAVFPDAEYYFGGVGEKIKRPAFLLLPVYFDEKKMNHATSRKTLELQIVFFGRTNGSGKEYFKDRMEVLEKLDGFLQQFELEVGDRWLHFDSEVKDADGQLAIYLRFQFLDEALDREALAESEAAGSVQVGFVVEGS